MGRRGVKHLAKGIRRRSLHMTGWIWTEVNTLTRTRTGWQFVRCSPISRVLWICKCDLQWLVSTVVFVGPAPLWIRIISEKKGFRSSGIWANIAPNSSGFGTENFVKQYRQLVPHLFRFYSFQAFFGTKIVIFGVEIGILKSQNS